MKKTEVQAQLALPEELEIAAIEMIDDAFTLAVRSIQEHLCCPLCGTPAQRFHSHYLRYITDPPSGGKCVRLLARKLLVESRGRFP